MSIRSHTKGLSSYLTLLKRGQLEDRDEIARLLAEARAAAEGLRIPEAEQIQTIQRRLGLEGA